MRMDNKVTISYIGYTILLVGCALLYFDIQIYHKEDAFSTILTLIGSIAALVGSIFLAIEAAINITKYVFFRPPTTYNIIFGIVFFLFLLLILMVIGLIALVASGLLPFVAFIIGLCIIVILLTFTNFLIFIQNFIVMPVINGIIFIARKIYSCI